MVSFEIFVKLMPPSLSELKVLPSFCFAFKIPDDVAVTSTYICTSLRKHNILKYEMTHYSDNSIEFVKNCHKEKKYVPNND